MDKQSRYKSDSGGGAAKKKKKNANLTDDEIYDKASKRAFKKTLKALDSVGTDGYVRDSAGPEAYQKNVAKTTKRLKKKRAGTGNHPRNK